MNNAQQNLQGNSKPPLERQNLQVEFNTFGDLLTPDESRLFVTQVDRMKLDIIIREIVTEQILPSVEDQQHLFEKIADVQKLQEKQANDLRQSKDSLDRANQIIHEFKKFDKTLTALVKQHQESAEANQINADVTYRDMTEFRTELNGLTKSVQSAKTDAKNALANNTVDMDKLDAIIGKYKQDLNSSNNEHLAEMMKEYQRVETGYNYVSNQAFEAIEKCKAAQEGYTTVELKISHYMDELEQVKEEQIKLGRVAGFEERIRFVEDEVIQARLLMQENIADARAQMSNAISRREMETTFIKYTSTLLEDVFGRGKLLPEVDANLDTQSQIKINLAKWKADYQNAWNEGRYVLNPQAHTIFEKELPSQGKLRKDIFMFELEGKKMYDTKPKYDQFGKLRSNSYDNRENDKWIKPGKTLQERQVIKKNVIVKQPKNYVPRFKREMPPPDDEKKTVEFDLEEDHNLTDNEEKEARALALNCKMSFEEVRKQKVEQKKKLIAQRKVEREKQKKLDAQKRKQAIQDAKYEWVDGQKVPLNCGVIQKNVNVRREHSANGRAINSLVFGEKFDQVYKPVQCIYGKEAYQEQFAFGGMIDNHTQSQLNQTFLNTGLGSAMKRNTKGFGTTHKSFAKQSKQISAQYSLPEPSKHGESQEGQMLIQESEGGDGLLDMVAMMRERKIRKGQKMRDRTTQWGASLMNMEPHAPQGMQFVNLDAIVDMLDLEEFKEDFGKEIAEDFDRRFQLADENIKELSEEQAANQSKIIARNKVEILNESNRIVQQILDKQLAYKEVQDDNIEEIREFIENQALMIKVQLAEKFKQQYEYNESINDRFMHLIKKIFNIKNDLDKTVTLIQKQLKDSKQDILQFDKQNETVLELMNSIVDTHYLESMLQIQDEFDRHQMSLWGMNSKTNSERNTQNDCLKIDEECFSCAMDKYRPMIKEAFKLSCVQYKPSEIPFRGFRFLRKQLIEVKDEMLMDSWCKTINKIEYLRRKFVSFHDSGQDQAQAYKNNFLHQLGQKLRTTVDNRALQRGQQQIGRIDELVINKNLQEQILKNPSNIGHLFEAVNDQHSLQQFKDQSLQYIEEESTRIISVSNSYRKIDRKTQSVIERLKESTSKRKNSMMDLKDYVDQSTGTEGLQSIIVVDPKKLNKINKREIQKNKSSLLNVEEETLRSQMDGENEQMDQFNQTGRTKSEFLDGHNQTELEINSLGVDTQENFHRVSKYNESDKFSKTQKKAKVVDSEYGIQGTNDKKKLAHKLNDIKRSSLPDIKLIKSSENSMLNLNLLNKNTSNQNRTSISQVFDIKVSTTQSRQPSMTQIDDPSQNGFSHEVKEAFSNLSNTQKLYLLKQMKKNNYDSKQMDNLAVFHGDSRKETLESARKRNNSEFKTSKEHLTMQINALEPAVGRNKMGYLYSQSKNGLLDDLRGPHANPTADPLKVVTMQDLYDRKKKTLQKINHKSVLDQIGNKNKNSTIKFKNKKIEIHTSQKRYNSTQRNEDTKESQDDAQTLIDYNSSLGITNNHTPMNVIMSPGKNLNLIKTPTVNSQISDQEMRTTRKLIFDMKTKSNQSPKIEKHAQRENKTHSEMFMTTQELKGPTIVDLGQDISGFKPKLQKKDDHSKGINVNALQQQMKESQVLNILNEKIKKQKEMQFLVPKMERMKIHSSKPRTEMTIQEMNKTPQQGLTEESQIIKVPSELREQFDQFYNYKHQETKGDIFQQFGSKMKDRLQESAEDDNFNQSYQKTQEYLRDISALKIGKEYGNLQRWSQNDEQNSSQRPFDQNHSPHMPVVQKQLGFNIQSIQSVQTLKGIDQDQNLSTSVHQESTSLTTKIQPKKQFKSKAQNDKNQKLAQKNKVANLSELSGFKNNTPPPDFTVHGKGDMDHKKWQKWESTAKFNKMFSRQDQAVETDQLKSTLQMQSPFNEKSSFKAGQVVQFSNVSEEPSDMNLIEMREKNQHDTGLTSFSNPAEFGDYSFSNEQMRLPTNN